MFIMIDKHDYAVCIWDPVYRLQLYRVGWVRVDVGAERGVDCVRRKMFAHEFFSLYLSCQRKHFVAPGFGIVVWLVYLWSNLQHGTWWHAGYWLGCCSGSFRVCAHFPPSWPSLTLCWDLKIRQCVFGRLRGKKWLYWVRPDPGVNPFQLVELHQSWIGSIVFNSWEGEEWLSHLNLSGRVKVKQVPFYPPCLVTECRACSAWE